MKLSVKEFFRCYAMHIFPLRFVRIRRYGVISNSCKKNFIEKGSKAVGLCNAEINTKQKFDDESSDNENLQENETKSGVSKIICPKCKKGYLQFICTIGKYSCIQNG